MASSSCTTETTTYVLEKYSRAYTPKKPSGGSEWQHFTNPVLRLILDSKLSPRSADSSLRMRIVWTMDGNQDVVLVCLTSFSRRTSGYNRGLVASEDLDLLAFSFLKDSSAKDKSDSPPLKGVCRDTTFGLRYLHVPESTESQKVGTSGTASFRLDLTALDRCMPLQNERAQREGQQNIIHLTGAVGVPVQRQDTIFTPNPALVSHHASSSNAEIQLQRISAVKLPHDPALPMPVSLLLAAQKEPQLSHGLPSSPAVPPAATSPSPHQSIYDHPMPKAPQVSSTLTGSGQPGLKPPPSSFPDSSPPSSTADSTMMPLPPPPFQVSNGTSTYGLALTAALRDATGLYDLSHAALERLVGDVVREDGLLLENISSMWAMKALVER
ncbi:hypothetical protein K438DRAFT_1964129 [Mycena galopus ATCC 62051]|nr:hypothetical protein K438DRAFT_1964129 [Mycena galopus ATCC 62051]